MRSLWFAPMIGILACLLHGCATVAGNATQRLSDAVSLGVLNQDDPAIVAAGLPAYLLLLDGMIAQDPDNAGLLLGGARLYGAYGGSFVDDPARAARHTERALGYARRAVCSDMAELCAVMTRPYRDFAPVVEKVSVRRTAVLYGLCSAWAGWIQANSEDWNAIADIPKVESCLDRVVELDDRHDSGMPHMYLGVLHSLRPESLGGKPEEGRAAFERALDISDGGNLMARVLYAEHYARLVFDQELHDRLLNEVLNGDVQKPGLTLLNVLARERARELLAESPDYF
ncbi:MAG TPA: TRAP transporter TatT component family protein [Xanthomonadaceae bacterium]|nr:TRAP transporter TatT component family protein [Xanthomonadaceae bacterium]